MPDKLLFDSERFNAMKKVGDYYPIVIEDTNGDSGRGRIVATGTLIVEQKFIHSCATVRRCVSICLSSGFTNFMQVFLIFREAAWKR